MSNLPAIQKELMSPSVMQRIETRLGEKAGTFITSVLDLCGEDKNLAGCNPKLVVKEALKAAALDLPINKNLGFAYVIPYGKEPNFQMGYKGYIQLAIRTGQYKHLNAGIVYEGETVEFDRIKGIMSIHGNQSSNKSIGYFCYMQLINGFEKAICWTKERVIEHRNQYSKAYKSKMSAWSTNFDAMALKTMVLQLIPKYGPMTIEMAQAMNNESFSVENQVSKEVSQNANSKVINIPDEDIKPKPLTDAEKAAIEAEEAQQPGF